jgi:hypothetical protein
MTRVGLAFGARSAALETLMLPWFRVAAPGAEPSAAAEGALAVLAPGR